MEYGTDYNTKYSEPTGPPPPYPASGQAQPAPAGAPMYPGQGQPPAPPPSYAPAQPAYPTSTGMQNTTVVVAPPPATVAVFNSSMLRDVPQSCTCPHCRQNIVTVVDFKVGSVTWLACIFLWFVGLGLGCCFIPFCLDVCKDAVHTCPSCNGHIGTFTRL
ncbi:lipopolysaccharide-induced tumor necrosis factor-alpha factor homolog [Ptychodera flava]|uniref:lipopolysaccharide-induced tumor necrosis factor-alpha factor homolog n=1 Tax=Ptychodera flava TaxID=63121 RepID=UPI00396A2016